MSAILHNYSMEYCKRSRISSFECTLLNLWVRVNWYPNVQRGQVVPITALVGQYVPKGVLHIYVVFLPSAVLDEQLEITNGFLNLNFIG